MTSSARIMRVLIVFTVIGMAGLTCAAQTWREVPLPEKFERILFAGDPLVPGQLALWGIRKWSFGELCEETWACYRSTDAGQEWLLIDTGRYTGKMDVDPRSACSICICGGKIVREAGYYLGRGEMRMEISEGGRSFKHIGTVEMTDTTEPNDLDIYFAADGSLYRSYFDFRETVRASLNLTIQRWSPGDTMWRTVRDTAHGAFRIPEESAPMCLTFDFRQPREMTIGTWNGVFRWIPDSLGWKRILTSTPLDSESVWPIMQHPADPAIWYAGLLFGGGLFGSVDSGRTWRRILEHDADQIAVSHRNPDLVAVIRGVHGAASDSIYISFDRGNSWYNLTRNIQFNATYVSVTHLDLTPVGLRVYLPTKDRLYVCDDAGATPLERPPHPETLTYSIHPQPTSKGSSGVLTVRVAAGAELRVEMFDVLGRHIALLLDSRATVSGNVSIPLRISNIGLTEGLYFVRLDIGATTKLVPWVVQ